MWTSPGVIHEMTAPIIVRTYKAAKQSKAAEAFAKDANVVGQEGYVPVSQSWAPPKFGGAGVAMTIALVCLLLGVLVSVVFLAVALVFLVLAVLTPDSKGELTVTYQRS